MVSDVQKKMLLELDIAEGNFGFASSIESAISAAENEMAVLDETIESVKDIKPHCDKLDYALAASSGAICGLIDIFLVGKPGESPVGDLTDKWFEKRTVDFAKWCGWSDDTKKTPLKFLEEKFKIPRSPDRR